MFVPSVRPRSSSSQGGRGLRSLPPGPQLPQNTCSEKGTKNSRGSEKDAKTNFSGSSRECLLKFGDDTGHGTYRHRAIAQKEKVVPDSEKEMNKKKQFRAWRTLDSAKQ